MRTLVALCGSVLAGLLSVGCALAFVFEVNGFGGDRDSGPQPLVLAGYGALGLICFFAGIVLWRWLLPRSWEWGLVAYVVAVVMSVVVLGVFA